MTENSGAMTTHFKEKAYDKGFHQSVINFHK